MLSLTPTFPSVFFSHPFSKRMHSADNHPSISTMPRFTSIGYIHICAINDPRRSLGNATGQMCLHSFNCFCHSGLHFPKAD